MKYSDVTKNPAEWGLPPNHTEFRPRQFETAMAYLEMDRGQVMVTEQKTGSGKSATVACLPNPPQSALRHGYITGPNRVVVVTDKKSLQQQYQSYGAEVLYGRGNYFCVNSDYPGATCAECPFVPEMGRCPVAGQCTYINARNRAMRAPFVALNYHLWMGMRGVWPEPDYLALDECHEISELVTGHYSVTVSFKDVRKYGLPKLPSIRNKTMTDEEMGRATLLWLHDAIQIVARYVDERNAVESKSPQQLKELKAAKIFGRKLFNVACAIRDNTNDWFIRSPRIPSSEGGATRPGLLIKPLTARHHAPGLFLSPKWSTIFLSATVGNRQSYTEEHGIPGNYLWRDVPSNFPRKSRLVVDLGAPRMSAKRSGPEVYATQAKILADTIWQLPEHWSGILHVTSKNEAKYLAGRLRGHGLGSRVWPMPDYIEGTENHQAAWQKRLSSVSNSILIAWSFWTGYDGVQERFTIPCKAPFPYLGDEFEVARMKHSKKTFNWRVAQKTEQACGRVRRGDPDHYDDIASGIVNGFVGLGDMNYRRVKSSYGRDFWDRIVTLDEYIKMLQEGRIH